MLLRLLLNPLSYFHPVSIRSITATASGRWIDSLLGDKIFKSYADDNSQIRSLKERISSWLSDANLALKLSGIAGLAQVPFLTSYDNHCLLCFSDVMAYRALPQRSKSQPSRKTWRCGRYVCCCDLLPHHEYLLPEPPTRESKDELEVKVDDADGKPKEVQAKY